MKNLTRTAVFISTAIEVYDLSIFAFLIPTLSAVFFKNHHQSAAIRFTILAYVVSYVVKPFSGLMFGYLSDGYGRKRVLSMTTILMILSTTAIGLLPTNFPGIVLWTGLFSCRILQGISISGEFTNGLILTVEQEKTRPAFAGSIAFMGGIFGLLLANAVALLLLKIFSHTTLLQYGWRIPFFISAVIWFCLYRIRQFINEPSSPMLNISKDYLSLLSKYRNELVICFICASVSASSFYITFVFMPTLLSSTIKSQSHFNGVLITLGALSVYFLSLPLFGLLADKVGLRKQMTITSILYLMFSYDCFDITSRNNFSLIICALILLALIQSAYNAALPAFMVSLFPKEHRGKSLAISYNISLTIFGGLMPLIILSRNYFINPGIFISTFALLAFITLHFVKD